MLKPHALDKNRTDQLAQFQREPWRWSGQEPHDLGTQKTPGGATSPAKK